MAQAAANNNDHPTGVNVGLGVRVSGVQKNFTEGDLKLTSNELDLAIEGKVPSAELVNKTLKVIK
jgi:flagellar basal-body rod protein FlgG